MTEEWWQINDFTAKLSNMMKEKFDDSKASVHYNTVDKWFKSLEDKRIHYIARAAGEKIYNHQDLLIGFYIADRRRDNKWRLDAIYETIADNMYVRPFPSDFGKDSPTTIDEGLMERRLQENLLEFLGKQFSFQEEKLNEIIQQRIGSSLKEMLPAPVNKEEERINRINDNLARMKIELKLEEQAIIEWDKLPEGERMKSAGWFRKEVDLIKRDNFIREYKRNNIEAALKEEYDTPDIDE